ncbi:hypothetical protein Leryth_025911 [Lithospermum erythrorhizon]|nr:hypothetical protein Leryth_025911 [Lithospermum erythrorhizon]
MFKFVLFVVLLLAVSASSQFECGEFYCRTIGSLCIVHEQCDSTYCDLYNRADENEYGHCATPPPNWGNCKFDNEDCTSNVNCCSGNCYTLTQYNLSYCNPPNRPPTPPIVFTPTPSPSVDSPALVPTPITIATPPPTAATVPAPVEDDTPTPTNAQSNRKMKHRHRRSRHSKFHGKTAFAPAPC